MFADKIKHVGLCPVDGSLKSVWSHTFQQIICTKHFWGYQMGREAYMMGLISVVCTLLNVVYTV